MKPIAVLTVTFLFCCTNTYGQQNHRWQPEPAAPGAWRLTHQKIMEIAWGKNPYANRNFRFEAVPVTPSGVDLYWQWWAGVVKVNQPAIVRQETNEMLQGLVEIGAKSVGLIQSNAVVPDRPPNNYYRQ